MAIPDTLYGGVIISLVTGGAGFVGSHLVDALLAEGESVRILERGGEAVADLRARGLDER